MSTSWADMRKTNGAELSAAAGTGGRELVEQLYRLRWAELCRYVRRTFGAGPPEPEEVAQAAFARLAALERPGDIENPRAFLYQCARNIVIDYRRREAVRASVSGDTMMFESHERTTTPDPERVLSSKQRLAIVEIAVRGMEPKRRRVLIMHAIHGLNYSEIARDMGLSPTRVTQLFASAVLECERAIRAAEPLDDETGR